MQAWQTDVFKKPAASVHERLCNFQPLMQSELDHKRMNK
jgi:hypothetical protein